MIISPLNDHDCLGAITQQLNELVAQGEPTLVALARELGTTANAIRWMRSLPQRDDTGGPDDGPRVEACAPPQRLRLPAPDPNCVERAALFCVLAEFLDPGPMRRLATIDTPVGRHTLPVQGATPVILDPRVPRNCAQAGVDVLGTAALPGDVATSTRWVCRVAAEPARLFPGGLRRLRNAGQALAAAADGVALHPTVADDVAMVLTLAAREARRWGPAGTAVVGRVADMVLELHRAMKRRERPEVDDPPPSAPAGARAITRNALELRVGRRRIRPNLPKGLAAALGAIGVVGFQAGTAVARAKLAMLGVSPAMLGTIESELNREGLSLGSLAKPPPPVGSFGGLTRDALVARHLERAGGDT